MIPIKAPEFQASGYNCPHCLAYARQIWHNVLRQRVGNDAVEDLKLALCEHCGRYTLWMDQGMIYPEDTGVLPPNADLQQDIKDDYYEAQRIVGRSPRGAAALLRLCLQKLCVQLGEKGENINRDIASLVGRGLPAKIQQALDIVRVVGNNAVHPGQIDLKDDREPRGTSLFWLTWWLK